MAKTFKHLFYWNFVLLALVVAFNATLTERAEASPKIDPKLRPLLGSSASNEKSIPVILVFKDKKPLPGGFYTQFQRESVENMLRENALESQAATVSQLTKMQTQNVHIQMLRFWLNNSIALYAPASVIRNLAQDEDLAAIYSNRHFKIFATNPVSVPTTQQPFTYGLEKMQIPQLRQSRADVDGRGVRVGILDTGIDGSHPDLRDRVLLFRDFIGKKTTPYDDYGHGTHVAGTISGGNASGTAIGVAPGVKLIVGKIFDGSGNSTDAEILQAMQWIADPDGNPRTNDGPMLVSNSWGGDSPTSSMDPADDPQCRALSGWMKLGILPVFAAGNTGPSPGSVGLPGACPEALAVGATDSSDHIAFFSSRGPAHWKTGDILKPLVSAPGVHVVSSVPGGKYEAEDGTSMATPHVAGLAALAYQVKPGATVAEVVKAIESGADNVSGEQPPDDVYGWGRVNAIGTLKKMGLR